jgi:hypothetical protein
MQEILDKIQISLNKIALDIAVMRNDLNHHIKRSDQNENEIKLVANRLTALEKDTQRQITDLVITITAYQKSIKIIAGVITLLNLIMAAVTIIKG